MGFHTYDVDRADGLEDDSRFRYLSTDELLALFDPRDGRADDEREPLGAVADLGSGTGFYTDEVAPYVDRVYAVDAQPEMHDYYREKGAPDAVEFVTAGIADLPFADGDLDGAFSTMTYHEFADVAAREEDAPEDAALAELARVLRPGARLGIADWTRNGEGREGPPREERFALADAVGALEANGFAVEYADERRETFVVRARRS